MPLQVLIPATPTTKMQSFDATNRTALTTVNVIPSIRSTLTNGVIANTSQHTSPSFFSGTSSSHGVSSIKGSKLQVGYNELHFQSQR